jgi:hypothetical protein
MKSPRWARTSQTNRWHPEKAVWSPGSTTNASMAPAADKLKEDAISDFGQMARSLMYFDALTSAAFTGHGTHRRPQEAV